MKKRKRPKIKEKFKEIYEGNKRSSVAVYFTLRFLVILCMILQIIRGDINNALLCLLSLILLVAPIFIQDKLKISFPNAFEIAIYLFIFAAEILGEINSFYVNVPYWDLLLHTTSGFLTAAIGFSLFDLLNKNSEKINLSPFYLALVAFCFSMTIGVFWEFYEFSSDRMLRMDMQKDTIVTEFSSVIFDEKKANKYIVIKDIDKTILYDDKEEVLATIEGGYLDIGLTDTMGDLFVNFIGALTFSFFGYGTLKNNNEKSFIKNFALTQRKKS